MPYASTAPSARITLDQLQNTCKVPPSVGATVTATYRANVEYFGGDKSWLGRVLPNNSPLAWTGTLAFHNTPTQAEVDAHIAQCRAMGLDMDDKTAVLWEYGTVDWEPFDQLIVLD
jgi:hypothetical protein